MYYAFSLDTNYYYTPLLDSISLAFLIIVSPKMLDLYSLISSNLANTVYSQL